MRPPVTMGVAFTLSTMTVHGNGDRAVRKYTGTPPDPPKASVSRWYPIALVFQYKAYSAAHLVQSGVGETIEIGSRGLRLGIPDELAPQITEMHLSIAWPAMLNGVTPLQWYVRAKPAWRAPGWLFVCIVSHEFRTAGVRSRQVMAACG